MGIAKQIPQIARPHTPQFYNLNGRTYLSVPILNKDENGKIIGTDYVIEFSVGSKGLSRQAKVVYRAPYLEESSPAIIDQAWSQAYAVWKSSLEKVGANT